MHQPVNEKDHEQFSSLQYDQEKRLADHMEAEVIEEMKGVAMAALGCTLRESHAADTSEFILARFKRQLNMHVIGFYNAKHAIEG